MTENYINHIALVLDASGSMHHLASEVVKVADNQIAYLARRSKELDQETRVSVYVFSDTVKCVIYDKDVLRLPSIASHYRTNGMTALIDATVKSQDDLAQTPELYGDHAFLTYILTDGAENASIKYRAHHLSNRLTNLRDNWTVAVLVPDQIGKHEAKKFGFPADNIAIWDATSVKGVTEAGDTIREATERFMVARTTGLRSSRSLFSTDADAINTKTVKDANLKAMSAGTYMVLHVKQEAPIREWIVGQGHDFRIGVAFYQLTKTESIQPQKNILVRNKKNGKLYSGPQARDLLGLPQMEVRVKPDFNPDYEVFVQSTSVNRKLVPGTRLILVP